MSVIGPATTENERELLAAARRGDEHAYGTLVEPHRRELHAHCYRMLGSVSDAEDALQESLLRAWRGLPGFEGRGSLRAWLYRIATTTCLKAIERRPKRVLPVDFGPAAPRHERPGAPLVESVWVEPYPDELLAGGHGTVAPDARYEEREAVELAFIAALQKLPARQRAVLILCDVLGFSGAEAADALETTTASVYSALQRAHRAVDERLPEQSQQATLRVLGDAALRDLVRAYVDAWERGDVDAVVSMLTEDALIAMPPMATWYRGRHAVAWFLRGWPLADGRPWRLRPAGANGQLAFGHYMHDEETGGFLPHGLNVLTLRGAQISEITAFLTPAAFARFGLPRGPI
jgi:RNA polymerase sigma-70 factor, ECF subfamily